MIDQPKDTETIVLVGGAYDGQEFKVHPGTLMVWLRESGEQCPCCESTQTFTKEWQPPGYPTPQPKDLVGAEVYEPAPVQSPGEPRKFVLV